MTGTAHISDCGRYRYRLSRSIQPSLDATVLNTRRPRTFGPCTFVMLNPSTADANQDDPTIRRCMGYARRLGFDSLRVVNLYAFRATDPDELWKVDDPIGPLNDHILQLSFGSAGSLIAAWGANAPKSRVDEILSWRYANFQCLGTTKDGAPRHPLYLRSNAQLEPWPKVAA